MSEEVKTQKTINQENLLCPKAGTATSSPIDSTPSHIDLGCGQR